MAPVLGVMADDFTGALMVAGYLEAAGVATCVLFAPVVTEAARGAAVVILAARTRVKPVAAARAEMEAGFAVLRAAGCGRLAYKACASFDSTAEGNIGLAADLLADMCGGVVLMSAGYPAFNATVHQGYLFYRGRLVSELDQAARSADPDERP